MALIVISLKISFISFNSNNEIVADTSDAEMGIQLGNLIAIRSQQISQQIIMEMGKNYNQAI